MGREIMGIETGREREMGREIMEIEKGRERWNGKRDNGDRDR